MKIKIMKGCSFLKKGLLINIMRIFLIFFCTTVFGLTPNSILSQNAKVSIEQDKVMTVDEVFNLIMEQTDYSFVYQVDMFLNSPKVPLKKGSIKVNTLLEKSLLNGNFIVDVNKNNIIIKKSNSIVKPQEQIVITGVVTGKDGMPLPGITVVVTDKEPKSLNSSTDFFVRGTATDFDGNFTIKAEVGNYIAASGIGYEFYSQKVSNNNTTLNIVLTEKASELDEVMVVGYGTTKKRDLTGTVGSVESKDIAQIQTQSIDQALTGKISGVLVGNSGGGLGDAGYVNIRGLSQINGDNQPLYVIDGIPIIMNPQFVDGLGRRAPRENPLLSINPADIERVDILKDASSAAIYGSRAANGVILITTKRGKLNQEAKFTYSLNTTIQNPTKLRTAQSAEQFRARIIENANLADEPTEEPIKTILANPDAYFGTANTDWQELLRNKDAIWTQHSIGVNGGSNSTSYSFSARSSNQEGVIKGHKLKRYSINSNISSNISEKLSAGMSVNYNYVINNSNGISSLNQGVSYRPDLALYDADGNPSGAYRPEGTGFSDDVFLRNPVLGDAKISNKAVSQNLLANFYAEYKILDGLKFRSNVSVNVSSNNTNNFSPSFTEAAARVRDNFYPSSTLSGALRINSTDNRSSTFTNTLNYNTTIGDKHTIDAVAGISWDQSRIDLEEHSYYGFPDDEFLTDIRSASNVYNQDSQSINNALNSIFGRVNYNYDNRYLVTFTGRRDGSIKFGPGMQYGFFPSGAIAWNVHNESFLEDNNTISQLKLRTSIGRTGADNLAAFTFRNYIAAGTFGRTDYAGINGIAPTGLPNRDIQWESTDQLDLGLEFGLFNNRLTGEIVYFEKNTSDIILMAPAPLETGFGTFNANLADVSTKGWEITVGGDIFRSQDFTWNSSFNISFINNNLDSLNGGSAFGTGLREGHAIGIIEGYKVVGIAQTQAEIDALNASAPTGIYDRNLNQPGDYIMEDVDNSGDIASGIEQDRQILGNTNPDYFGGWNNNFSYKNWNASFNFQYVGGVDKAWNEFASYDLIQRSFTDNNPTFVQDILWTPTNTDAEYARMGNLNLGSSQLNFTNSRQVVDGSYIRLRSASVGYNLPKEILDKIGLSSLGLTLSGNNLFVITNYPGLDPDSNSTPINGETRELGIDYGGGYPSVRSFTLGLNVTF